MPKILTGQQARKYQEDGYHSPVRVMTAEQARSYRAKLEAFEESQGGSLNGRTKQKLYLLLTWMDELVRHPRILDAVEDVLGPDILCWQAGFFIKEPNSQGFVTWHQDSTYWGLSAPDVCTAWLALSPATVESGAMIRAPGTHKLDQLPHGDTFDTDNLLTRGQELSVDIDRSNAVDLVLEPGEISLHHVMLAHASEPNKTGDRRIGLAIRYVAPHVRQITGVPDSAMLVRGEDRFGHFETETPPLSDLHPDAVALHDRVTRAREGFIYQGTDEGAHRGGDGVTGND
jgi:non-heme Fe2+,alpha-ketoglutarate-dependent halogenase